VNPIFIIGILIMLIKLMPQKVVKISTYSLKD